jgi:hypothetical protein
VLEIDNLNFSTQNVENDRFVAKEAVKPPFSAKKPCFYQFPILPQLR